jgi:hypothetical protein
MIDHTNCDHPRTSGARAKCRRAHRNGGATPTDIDFTERAPREKAKPKGTPRDRDMQCDVCGVERIEIRGTDPLTGVILSVGEKCSYVLKIADDVEALA